MEYMLTIFAKNCSHGFFGLVPWYHYLNLDSQCNITNFNIFPPKSDVPLVLLAIIDDLLRIAGILAVGFVIFGAIKYIASQGNPEDVGRAQSTIINALVGLAIATVAIAFVSFLGNSIGG
jgi:FtsH-binding integral membrane protein